MYGLRLVRKWLLMLGYRCTHCRLPMQQGTHCKRPTCRGTHLGHHFTLQLSSTYDSSINFLYFSNAVEFTKLKVQVGPVDLPCLTKPPPQSHRIATTQRHESGKERRCKLMYEKRSGETGPGGGGHPPSSGSAEISEYVNGNGPCQGTGSPGTGSQSESALVNHQPLSVCEHDAETHAPGNGSQHRPASAPPPRSSAAIGLQPRRIAPPAARSRTPSPAASPGGSGRPRSDA